MLTVLLYFLFLCTSSLVACAVASIPDALDLILGTDNFYRGHQPSDVPWEYLTSAVLELINEELDQLEAASRNPSSLGRSILRLFERRFAMFYPTYLVLANVPVRTNTGHRVVADVEEVFVKPTDLVTANSKICAISGHGQVLAGREGMVVRVCKVGKRMDLGAFNSLAYIVELGDVCPNANKAAIHKWIDVRKQARASHTIAKGINTRPLPHLDSYHPSVLDEVQRIEIYPEISRLVEEATVIHLRLQEPLKQKYSEHSIRLFYYRLFFPSATQVESIPAIDPERNQKVVEWLGIKVGEQVVMNQPVAKCTDKTLMTSHVAGLVIKINMRVGKRLPSPAFFVLNTREKPENAHPNSLMLINAFYRKNLETVLNFFIHFTNNHGNPRVDIQAQIAGQCLSSAPLTIVLLSIIPQWLCEPVIRVLDVELLKTIEVALAAGATFVAFSARKNFESPTVQDRQLFAEYQNFIRLFYRSKSGGKVDVVVDFSTASVQSNPFGEPFWGYKVLGDAELFFDESKRSSYDSFCNELTKKIPTLAGFGEEEMPDQTLTALASLPFQTTKHQAEAI
jgi:hypothetical protein